MEIINLRKYRKARNMTQAELGQLCGIGESTVSEIENRTHAPAIWVALRLARALEVDVTKLFVLVEK